MDAAQKEAPLEDESPCGAGVLLHSGESNGLQNGRYESSNSNIPQLIRGTSAVSQSSSSLDLPGLSDLWARRSSSPNRFRLAAWNFLEDPESSWAASRFDRLFPAFILLAVCFTLVQLLGESLMSSKAITIGELCIDVLFALEILIRFVSCPHRWSFFGSPYNLIDIAAALPLGPHLCIALEFLSEDGLRVQSDMVLSFVPVLRILKTLRRFKEFHLLLEAFHKAFEALPVVLYFYCVLLLFFGAVVHVVEPHDNIGSLFQALWFTIVSMSTVGYGDITPVSEVGKCVTALLVITSTLYMPIPLGIIGNCFSEVWRSPLHSVFSLCARVAR